jgi:uncharacterized protein (TIGR01777 family)
MANEPIERALKILVAGGSGTIGSYLVPFLKSHGHVVELLHRKDPEAHFFWDPEHGILRGSLEGYDAVINLAGYSVASGRWNKSRKEKILQSRVMATALLVDRIKKCQAKPRVFITASATGYYGDTSVEEMTESQSAGVGFLATVCQKWEDEARKLESDGVRVVMLRIGMVLTPRGGALGKMVPAFRMGLGGPLGSGKQKLSWIGIDDLVSIVNFALLSNLQGPVNAVAGCVTNEEFTKILARVLHRPACMRVPAFVLRLLFGEMADEILLASASVSPKKLLDAGFSFQSRDLETTLRTLLGHFELPNLGSRL